VRVLDRLQDLAEVVNSRQGLYVRFSDGPEDDRSKTSVDYESGLTLPGLSANRLDPPSWWSRSLADWLARQVCQYAHLRERSPSHRGWVLAGTVIDRGPDDEPLLSDIEPVAWLGEPLLTQSKTWYEEHFHPGRTQA
jgi:hypothetical protein